MWGVGVAFMVTLVPLPPHAADLQLHGRCPTSGDDGGPLPSSSAADRNARNAETLSKRPKRPGQNAETPKRFQTAIIYFNTLETLKTPRLKMPKPRNAKTPKRQHAKRQTGKRQLPKRVRIDQLRPGPWHQQRVHRCQQEAHQEVRACTPPFLLPGRMPLFSDLNEFFRLGDSSGLGSRAVFGVSVLSGGLNQACARNHVGSKKPSCLAVKVRSPARKT